MSSRKSSLSLLIIMRLLFTLSFLLTLVFTLNGEAKSQSLKLHHGSSNTYDGQIDVSGQAFVEISGPRGLPVTIKLSARNKRVRFLFYEIHGSAQFPNRTIWSGKLSNNVIFGVTITGPVGSMYKLSITAK